MGSGPDLLQTERCITATSIASTLNTPNPAPAGLFFGRRLRSHIEVELLTESLDLELRQKLGWMATAGHTAIAVGLCFSLGGCGGFVSPQVITGGEATVSIQAGKWRSPISMADS
jgi:hypothetical protein